MQTGVPLVRMAAMVFTPPEGQQQARLHIREGMGFLVSEVLVRQAVS
jgi:hypothetical protein